MTTYVCQKDGSTHAMPPPGVQIVNTKEWCTYCDGPHTADAVSRARATPEDLLRQRTYLVTQRQNLLDVFEPLQSTEDGKKMVPPHWPLELARMNREIEAIDKALAACDPSPEESEAPDPTHRPTHWPTPPGPCRDCGRDLSYGIARPNKDGEVSQWFCYPCESERGIGASPRPEDPLPSSSADVDLLRRANKLANETVSELSAEDFHALRDYLPPPSPVRPSHAWKRHRGIRAVSAALRGLGGVPIDRLEAPKSPPFADDWDFRDELKSSPLRRPLRRLRPRRNSIARHVLRRATWWAVTLLEVALDELKQLQMNLDVDVDDLGDDYCMPPTIHEEYGVHVPDVDTERAWDAGDIEREHDGMGIFRGKPGL